MLTDTSIIAAQLKSAEPASLYGPQGVASAERGCNTVIHADGSQEVVASEGATTGFKAGDRLPDRVARRWRIRRSKSEWMRQSLSDHCCAA